MITFIEYIDTIIDDEISKIDFFLWSETKLLDSQCLLSGQSSCSSHELFDIGRLWSVIPRASHLAIVDLEKDGF